MTALPPSISLRAPTTTTTTTKTTIETPPQQQTQTPFTAPTLAFLAGTWHVTHSTLPMWRTKRNVTITYTPLPASSPPGCLHDLVAYQTLSPSSSKRKTIEGIDTPAASGGSSSSGGGEWDWRGKGWLRIAGSHWEVLGWGDLPGKEEEEGEKDNQWAVTYFAKTLFTPPGVDVYSRRKEGVGEEVLGRIREALEALEDEGVRGLVRGLFEVRRD